MAPIPRPMDWHLCGMIAIGSTLKAGRQQLQPLLRSRRIAQPSYRERHRKLYSHSFGPSSPEDLLGYVALTSTRVRATDESPNSLSTCA